MRFVSHGAATGSSHERGPSVSHFAIQSGRHSLSDEEECPPLASRVTRRVTSTIECQWARARGLIAPGEVSPKGTAGIVIVGFVSSLREFTVILLYGSTGSRPWHSFFIVDFTLRVTQHANGGHSSSSLRE